MFACICMIFSLPWAGLCLTLYPLKSLNLSLVGTLPSSPHTVSYLPHLSWPLMHPSGLRRGPQECNLLSTGIDQAHKVLISTLGWITGASLHDCAQPFHCIVPLSARENFTSLESAIGCAPGPLLLSSAVKDPTV